MRCFSRLFKNPRILKYCDINGRESNKTSNKMLHIVKHGFAAAKKKKFSDVHMNEVRL